MEEEEKKRIADDAMKVVERIANLHGKTVVNMPKDFLMILIDCYVEGAKMAILTIKKYEKEGGKK